MKKILSLDVSQPPNVFKKHVLTLEARHDANIKRFGVVR